MLRLSYFQYVVVTRKRLSLLGDATFTIDLGFEEGNELVKDRCCTHFQAPVSWFRLRRDGWVVNCQPSCFGRTALCSAICSVTYPVFVVLLATLALGLNFLAACNLSLAIAMALNFSPGEL